MAADHCRTRTVVELKDMASAYDDLQFASTREQAERRALCPECDETRTVGVRDTLCPCCGALLVAAEEQPGGAPGTTGAGIFSQLPGGMGGGMADLVARMTNEIGGGAGGGAGVSEADLQSVINRIMELEQHGGGGGSHAASAAAIGKLRKHVVSTAAGGARAVLEEVTLVVKADAAARPAVVLVQAGFGPSLATMAGPATPGVIEGLLVAGDPLEGQGEALSNSAACAGRVVVLKRGAVSFARKARVAQEAGAAALLVVQTCDVWPYTMMDKAGESTAAGYEQAIPALMLRQEHGMQLLSTLQERERQGLGAPMCCIRAEKSGAECPICQDGFADGAVIVQMPCLHSFHEECLMQWLKRASNCPTCRLEVESEDAEWNQRQRQRQAASSDAGGNSSAEGWFG